jgi:AraC family L-rhamnose operon transcriptional activator RhaR
MNTKMSYYDTGENFFGHGEPIYINKAYEQVEAHLHAHDFIEIAYVMSGCGIHSIGENEYSVSKGDLFIINYDIPHEFRSLPDPSKPQLIVYNCVFRPEFLDYTLVNCKDFYEVTHHFLFQSLLLKEMPESNDIKLIDNETRDIEEIYEKMYREYQIKEEGYIEILRAYVIELLITIFRLYRKNKPLYDSRDLQRRQLIDKVIRYMKDNYSKELKLEDLSTIAFLSPNYFSKLFKDCTAMTLSEYIQKIRIEEACKLLTDTDKKIIEIAYDVGYKDTKFFNQLFKKIVGKTPGGYRKDRKNL